MSSPDRAQTQQDLPRRADRRVALLVAGAGLALFVVIGWLRFGQLVTQGEDRWRAELSSSGEITRNAIAGWWRDRVADAQILGQWLGPWDPLWDGPMLDDSALGALNRRLNPFMDHREYLGVWLVSAEGEVLGSADRSRPLETVGQDLAAMVMRTGMVQSAGPWPMGPDSVFTIAVAAPAYSDWSPLAEFGAGIPDSLALNGAVVLYVDASHYLIPAVFLEQTPTETGTSGLVWQGDGATFAVALLPGSTEPMLLTFRDEVPDQVRLAADGAETFGRFTRPLDFEPVLAVVGGVDGSNWGVVREVTVAEALSDTNAQFRVEMLGLFFLLGMIGLGVMALTRHHRIVSISREVELERFHALHLEERVAQRTRELEASRSLLESILNSVGEGVLAVDESGRFIVINEAARALIPPDVVGVTGPERSTNVPLRRPGSDLRLTADELPSMRALAGESVRGEEFIVTHGNGEESPILVTANPIVDGDKVRGSVVVFRDVTAMKEVESQLRDSVNDLRSFSYSVSHDLKTPLRAVLGFANLLRKRHSGDLSEDAKEKLTVVIDSAQRMGEMIDGLLSFALASRQDITPRDVNVADTFQSTFDHLITGVPERDVALEIDGDLPVAFVDPGLFQHVAHNLLDNAIKYTNRPGRRALVTVGGATTDRGSQFFVRDNGVGFDPEHADKLFQPFQRLHAYHEFEGTGIGLATVERIVVRHGGAVWAESGERGGATFYFVLPRGGKSV